MGAESYFPRLRLVTNKAHSITSKNGVSVRTWTDSTIPLLWGIKILLQGIEEMVHGFIRSMQNRKFRPAERNAFS